MALNSPSDFIQPEMLCTARISTLSPHFTEADQAIADLTINHPQTVAQLSARQLGSQCGVSEASVIRFVQKLGYKGLDEFREALKDELVSSQTTAAISARGDGSPGAVLTQVVALCTQALQALLTVLDVNELYRAAEAIKSSQIVHLFATGGSIRIAQHASFKLMRMGYLSVAIAEPFSQMAQASLTFPSSVAFGISYTGKTKSVCDALTIARSNGAVTVCLTNFAGTAITQCCEIKLITGAPGGVLAANSAQSRAAQFAVLDSLFALLPVRKGNDGAIAF